MTDLLYSDDLFWSSKILETAKSLGRVVVRARSLDELTVLAERHTPAMVILDLNTRGIDVSAVVARVRTVAPQAQFRAFGRHTDEEGLERARAAGCDPVLARSTLQAKLPEYLGEWLGAPATRPR
jgi:CheY-like chemotaxis protein